MMILMGKLCLFHVRDIVNNNIVQKNIYRQTKTSLFYLMNVQQQQQQTNYHTSNNVHQKTKEEGGKIIENNEMKAKFVEDGGVRMTPRERLKQMVIVYGPLATVLHIGLSLTFLGITYLIVKFGFDATGMIEKRDLLGETYMKILSTGGTFGVAYAIYKALMPFRVMVTFYLTPKVARKLQSMNLIKRRF